jgi:PhzF family phenazine biosynthesis protein
VSDDGHMAHELAHRLDGRRRYAVVDVFGSAAYCGNPLAVVVDGDGLSDAEMHRFANWTNLSETTFLLPPTQPGADYRVRIFTTTVELPFAGHPTLGSCHAWLAAGGEPADPERIVQECAAGLVDVVRAGDGGFAFAAPPLMRDGPLDGATLTAVVDVLGIDAGDVVDAAWVDNGPGWLAVLLAGADAVLALRPTDSDHKIGVVAPHPAGHDAAYEVRAFFPADGRTFEDPVTGSLNASLAQWLVGTGRVEPPYTATQGAALGRDGRVTIDRDAAGRIWVGGRVVTCVDGTVEM